MNYIPDDFDFTDSQIEGFLGNYKFKEELKSGSQGRILVYSNEKTGEEVLFKHYPKNMKNSSSILTQESKGFEGYINEENILHSLTYGARISTFFQEYETEQKEGIIYYNGEEMLSIFSEAISTVRSEKVIKNRFCVFPIIEDKIFDLKYKKKTVMPHCKPKNSFAKDFIDVLFERDKRIVVEPNLITYIKGKNLEDIINKANEETVKNILQSISYIHYLGVVHKDIKPDNIIIDNKEKTYLVDFGIAKHFNYSDKVCEIQQDWNLTALQDNLMNSNTRGSRIFSLDLNENPQKADIFSGGIIAAIILTGYHPYIEECSYEELKNKDKKDIKIIKEKTKNLLQKGIVEKRDSEYRDIKKLYHKFINRHPQVHKYKKLFDPDLPINRLSRFRTEFGIETPLYPNCALALELDSNFPFKKTLTNKEYFKGYYLKMPEFGRVNIPLSEDAENLSEFLSELSKISDKWRTSDYIQKASPNERLKILYNQLSINNRNYLVEERKPKHIIKTFLEEFNEEYK